MVVLVLVALVWLLCAPAAEAYEWGPTITPLGPEEKVFDWDTMKCADENIPDLPARAFRDSSNQVNLLLSHYTTWRMRGPDLNTVTVDCSGPLMSSHYNADPATYDDAEWIASPYTLDGTKVGALVHEEYHGWDHPGQCGVSPIAPRRLSSPAPFSAFDPACWYNSITSATSTNGGATFTHAPPPTQLLASVPYKYVPNTGPYGYFTPSNIVRNTDNYYYFMIQALAYGAQKEGDCLVRSRNPTVVTSWRAWDGTGWGVKFVNPYTSPDPPEEHVCEPVDYTDLFRMNSSLTYNTYFQKWLLIGDAWDVDEHGDIRWGFFYSTSSDLINWSPRQLLMDGEMAWEYQCGDEDPVAYSVVLNPGPGATGSRNFDRTSRQTYLYFTRLNYSNCIQTLDRDLIRVPIQFNP